MKIIKITTLIITILFCKLSFSQINERTRTDTIYVMIPSSHEGFVMRLSKDSTRVSFGIIKYQYRTKQQQQQFYDKVKKSGMQNTSFYYSFYGLKKPIKIKSIDSLKLTPIENISKWEEKIGHKTKIFFIEKINCREYLIHETRMQFEE